MYYQRLRHILTGIVLLGMLGASQGATADMNEHNQESSPTQSLLQALELHHQGWGLMGRDVAAHAAESEPLSLRIADQEYAHGFGVHAPSESVFSLEGRYLRFEAEVGVQWQEGGPGSVVFAVYVDDERVFQSDVMTEETPAQPISINLEGADELRLVVTDAGDGITNDAANWANARLTPDPDAAALEAEAVNIAVFGRVNTSDPQRKEGIRASRLEEVAAEDLFLDTQLLPHADGHYEAPLWEDVASIGVQWVERRRVRHLGLTLAPEQALPAADSVQLEFWEVPRHGITPGGAPWQGQWSPLPGNLDIEGRQLTFTIDWADAPERNDGVYKFRWLIADQNSPVQVEDAQAFTTIRWTENEFTIVLDPERITRPVSLELYNGFFDHETEDAVRTHRLESAEATLSVRHAMPGRFRMADRTVLRFRPDNGAPAFAVALDDVLREGRVYVPHAGTLVKTPDADATIAAMDADIEAAATIRERVELMPEQTLEQAIEHVHRAEGDLGPTMLSLANDNFKFVLTREGELRFEPDMEKANLYETGLNQPYPLAFKPVIEGAALTHEDIQRHFLRKNNQWYPVADIRLPHAELEIVQRCYVAPLEMPGEEVPAWKSRHPLGVMELTLHNHGETTATLPMRLQIQHNNPEALRVEAVDNHWLVFYADQPVARLAAPRIAEARLTIDVTEDQDLRVAANLEAGESLPLTLFFPRWTLDAEAILALPTDRDFLQQTVAHWDAVMAGAMCASLPNQKLEDLMRASIIHCLLAARNEDYARIAPWIASIFYGPLESESNAIIRGLSYWGHDDFTRRALEYYIDRYNDAGFLTTGYTTMGTGWHLWSVGEYIRLSQDLDWLQRHADEFARVGRWLMAQCEKTRVLDAAGNPVPEYGLAPPGPAADWESFQYYFYINGYYYVGLKSIAQALARIDHPEAAATLAHAETHRGHILDAFRYAQERAPVVRLRDGSWAPFNPTHPYAWGLMEDLYPGQDVGRSWAYDVELGSHHLVPMGVLPPFAQETEWLLDHMEDVQFLKSGWMYYPQEENEADWFNLGGFAKVQPYYARNHDIYAMRREVKPFLRAYFNSIASLLNREDLSLWEHFFNGAYNKTHETGYLVYQSRLMLLMEEGDGLWLAPFIPETWFLQTRPVVVRDAPTEWGTISYRIDPHPAANTISLEADLGAMRNLPETLLFQVRLPQQLAVSDIAVETGKLSLDFDSEEQLLRIEPEAKELIALTLHYTAN